MAITNRRHCSLGWNDPSNTLLYGLTSEQYKQHGAQGIDVHGRCVVICI